MEEHSDLEHYQRNLFKACYREAAFEGKEAASQRGLDEGYLMGFLDGFHLNPALQDEEWTPEMVEQRIQQLKQI